MGLKMNRICVATLLLGTLILAGCISSSFAENISKLRAIEAKYNVGAENFVPSEQKKLSEFKKELAEFKAELDKQFFSADAKAVSQFVEIKLEIAEMEKNLLDARPVIAKVLPLNPDCSENGSVKKSTGLLDKALRNANLALEKNRIFENNYAAQAKGLSTELESIRTFIENSNISIDSANKILISYCGTK